MDLITFQDDSDTYEELDGNMGNGNGLEDIENNPMGYASPMDNTVPASPKLSTHDFHEAQREFGNASRQLQCYLDQFYLIRTPFGYILGRKDPAIEATSASGSPMQTPKPPTKSAYGEFSFYCVWCSLFNPM